MDELDELDATVLALAELTATLDRAIAAVHDLEHDALRWESPVGPHVELLRGIRKALGIEDEHYGDLCRLCRGAGDRWRRDHRTEPDWSLRTGGSVVTLAGG